MNYNILNYPEDIIERFWSKVNVKYINNSPNFYECMEWTAALNNDGYGSFSFGTKMVLAHRFVYECFNGKIDPKLCICHECDNRKCVNPYHLWIGSRFENNHDCSIKGRISCGENFIKSKLTNEDVLNIVKLFNTHSAFQIAELYNVSMASIYRIKYGKTWSHLTNIKNKY